jgi:hypothetical protein
MRFGPRGGPAQGGRIAGGWTSDEVLHMPGTDPFYFVTERRLVRLTGRKARTLGELLRHLREVSGASVFYHTHHLYLSHHFQRPEFYNDFASWTKEALQETALPEQLAAVDLLSFTGIRPLREALIGVIERRQANGGPADRTCPPGDEFHFCESQSFVLPTGLVATTPGDFFETMPRVSTTSIFYHFFEARLRLGRTTNDFSAWLAACGDTGRAQAIDRLDPYLVSLEELRQQIIEIGGAPNAV